MVPSAAFLSASSECKLLSEELITQGSAEFKLVYLTKYITILIPAESISLGLLCVEPIQITQAHRAADSTTTYIKAKTFYPYIYIFFCVLIFVLLYTCICARNMVNAQYLKFIIASSHFLLHIRKNYVGRHR